MNAVFGRASTKDESFLSGTLVVSVRCKPGYLIVADKRVTADALFGGVNDNEVKIHKADKFTAFTCVGKVKLVDWTRDAKTNKPIRMQMLFNADKAVKDTLRQHPIKGTMLAQTDDFMCMGLNQAFRKPFEGTTFESWPPTPPMQPVFVVCLYHFDYRSKTFQHCRYNFYYKQPSKSVIASIEVQPENETAADMQLGKWNAMGDGYQTQYVVSKLGRAKAKYAMSVPDTPTFPSASAISLEQAKSMAGKLISMTRELQEQDPIKKIPTISKNVDVAIVASRSGFHKLKCNVPAASLVSE